MRAIFLSTVATIILTASTALAQSEGEFPAKLAGHHRQADPIEQRRAARALVGGRTPYADRVLQFCEAGPNAAAAIYSFTAPVSDET